MPNRSTGPDEVDIPVHSIDGSPLPTRVDPEVVAYGWGDKEVPADSPEALAKKVTDPTTGRVRHWLKRATTGPESGSLFNPQSPSYTPGSLTWMNAALGKGRYEFRATNLDAFDYYRHFLRTNNPLYLRYAERSSYGC